MKKTTTPSSTGYDKKTTPRGPSNATLMLLRMAARTYSPTPATGRLDGSLCPELIFSHNLFRKSDSMVYLCVTTKMHLS